MPKYTRELDEQGNPTGRFLITDEKTGEREDLIRRKTELNAQINTCNTEIANITAIRAHKDELVAERDAINILLA